MAQAAETPEEVSIASGATDVFPTIWTFADPSEVSLTVETDGVSVRQSLGLDYLVAPGDWLNNGANIVFQPGRRPASGSRVIRRRVTAATQPEPFGDLARFSPEQSEKAYDKLTRLAQEAKAVTDRSLVVKVGETPPVLPSAPAELMFVGRDPDGALVYLDPTFAPGDLTLFSGWRGVLGSSPADFAVKPDGRPEARTLRQLIGNGFDKTPIVDWKDLRVLWNGDSISHYGAGIDGVPELVARQMEFGWISNRAWAGSHLTFDGLNAYAALTTRAERLSAISSLTMMNADVAMGLARFGPSSAFHPDYDPITKAMEMTAEARILPAFAAGEVDVWVDAHGHNDRNRPAGSLNPPSMVVVGVTKGATTIVQTSGLNGLAVGDGVALRLTGIAKLAYGAGVVTAVNTGTQSFTVALDSSGYAGVATGGVAEKMDRGTVYGAQAFSIHLVRWAALHYGRKQPRIVLISPPSEFTDNSYSPTIYSIGRLLQDVATRFGERLFDLTNAIRITATANNDFLPDKVHATTVAARRVLANFIADWMSGGATGRTSALEWIARASGDLVPGIPLESSRWLGEGVGTPTFVESGTSSIMTEDFVSIADWITLGTPTIVDAPWPGGGKAMRSASVGGSEPYIVRLGLSAADAVSEAFDFWIDQTVGLVPNGVVGLGTLGKIETSTGPWITMTLVAVDTGAWLQFGHFNADAGAADSYVVRAAENRLLSPIKKYRLRVDAVKATADRDGAALVYLDNELLFAGPIPMDDEAVPSASVLTLGVSYCNIPSLTVHFGNLTYDRLVISPNGVGHSGDVVVGGKTLSFSRGRLMAVAG